MDTKNNQYDKRRSRNSYGGKMTTIRMAITDDYRHMLLIRRAGNNYTIVRTGPTTTHTHQTDSRPDALSKYYDEMIAASRMESVYFRPLKLEVNNELKK